MMKKIIIIFLALSMFATMLPFAVQAKTDPNEVDLEIDNLGRTRKGSCLYNFSYRLYNNGPDNIINEDFYDRSYYKSGGNWYYHTDSEIHHENFYLNANQYSPYYYWEGYLPSGWHWFSTWTDVFDDVDETNENNNDVLKFWYFY